MIEKRMERRRMGILGKSHVTQRVQFRREIFDIQYSHPTKGERRAVEDHTGGNLWTHQTCHVRAGTCLSRRNLSTDSSSLTISRSLNTSTDVPYSVEFTSDRGIERAEKVGTT